MTPAGPAGGCPADPELAQFLAADGAAERLRGHIDSCPRCLGRLEDLCVDPELAPLLDTPPVSPHTRLFTGDHSTGWRGPPPADAPAPAEIGGYRVVCELGRGGMGVVYEAIDPALGRRLAVKVVRPEFAARADARDRFLREARALAAVEHDHVVPVLHYGVADGSPFLVMPLLRGEPLVRRLAREGSLPGAEVARIGRETAAGLVAVHAAGLVHRDLKPANVWLDADTGRARLLDFGLARCDRRADALTEEGAVVGTPPYMAPEQIDGHDLDGRADLFALGAVLYECATGRRAFPGDTVTAALHAVTAHDPAPPAARSGVPPALSALILRLLAKNLADRPRSAAEVVNELDAIRAGGRLTVAGNRGAKRVAAAAAFVAAVAAVAVLARGRPEPTPEPRAAEVPPPPAVRYRGKVDVLVAGTRDGRDALLRLDEPSALPLRTAGEFRVEGEVDPPAFVYVVWVDPGGDVTPMHPWDPTVGWGSRPAAEQLAGRVSLPPRAGKLYRAEDAKPGMATVVLFARSTPLDVPDDVVKGWFAGLPELPLPPGGPAAAVWFDDFVESRDPLRRRTFGEVEARGAFARWQGQLQRAMGKVEFQSAVSFARTNQTNRGSRP